MRKSRFTEEQIIAFLAEHELGVPTADICRKRGLSTATFYKWKAKYGGMDVSEARRLKALEDENAKLKKLRDLANERRRATVVCSCCCDRGAKPQASTESTGSIAKRASRCASGAYDAERLEREPRSWSKPRRTPAGRWTLCTISLPAAAGSGFSISSMT